MKRRQNVIYLVVLKEHPEVVKIGRTTNWKQRRGEYDRWNFAKGDGILRSIIYVVTEEYVDLSSLETACIEGIACHFPRHHGNEWFKGDAETAMKVVEGVLSAASLSYITHGK